MEVVTKRSGSAVFGRLQSTFLKIDNFGTSFAMKLEKREDMVRSYVGSFCSLILGLFVVAYTFQKFEI